MYTKIKKNAIILFAIFIIIFSAFNVVLVGKRALATFKAEAEYQVSQVEKDVQISSNFVNYMSFIAQDHFNENSYEVDELYYELEYNSSDEIYYLEVDESISDVGYLSGTGEIPVTEEVTEELNLVFEFNKYFELFYTSADNICSVYYLSESGFLNLYPYNKSEVTTYDESLHNEAWYTNAIPENNPERLAVWSTPYVDTFGNGVILTLSMPIYDGDDFKGVVAIDCKVEEIVTIFDSEHDTYLCDSDGSIIASNTEYTENSDEVKNVDELSSDELSSVINSANVQSNEVEFIDGNFTFALNIENTDWIYVSIIPIGELLLYSLLISSPVILLLLALLFILVNSKRRQAQIKLEAKNEVLEEEVNKRIKEIGLTKEATIDAVSALTEFRDNDTGNHILRTKKYVRLLAENLENTEKYQGVITPEKIQELTMSAPLHDIGKVGIKDEILMKPGKLTVEERSEIQKHAIIGHEALLKAAEKLGENSFLDCALELTRYHHEKWDGSGYPDNLAGENIPLSARIMAIADVYDALTNERVYKAAMTHEEAIEIIISDSGTHFDPEIVEVFKKCEANFKKIAEEHADG